MRFESRLFRCSVMSVFFVVSSHAQQQQLVDAGFKPRVDKPAYRNGGPTVAIDESHFNYHTVAGPYRPFADLLRADGYTVKAFTQKFETSALAGMDILVIANARGPNAASPGLDAFTDQECNVVQEWVRDGGSLLLIADHAPFGSAADNLARHFGVFMGKGYAFERTSDGNILTDLTFSREGGSLGRHPILTGRDSSEEIRIIKSFAGQSLVPPDGATVLMPFSRGAWEALPEDFGAELLAARNGDGNAGTHSVSLIGRAQGIASPFGKGRVVVLGEAAMLTAQLLRSPDGSESRFGMNTDGTDNCQFALNVLHWLSRLL